MTTERAFSVSVSTTPAGATATYDVVRTSKNGNCERVDAASGQLTYDRTQNTFDGTFQSAHTRKDNHGESNFAAQGKVTLERIREKLVTKKVEGSAELDIQMKMIKTGQA